MTGRSRVMWQAIVVAALLSLVASAAANAQMKKGSHTAPSTETKPKVDEKAYKAALDRIPTPKKPYDPWGQVHEPEPAAKPSGKPN
jgi:flagellar basal body-associated protein FliL